MCVFELKTDQLSGYKKAEFHCSGMHPPGHGSSFRLRGPTNGHVACQVNPTGHAWVTEPQLVNFISRGRENLEGTSHPIQVSQMY